MKKRTKLTIGWFYELLERGKCDIMDIKEQFEDKSCGHRVVTIHKQAVASPHIRTSTRTGLYRVNWSRIRFALHLA